MTLITIPEIIAADRRINLGWDGESLTALAGLSIRWGRQSWYDDIKPSTLELAVIDPDLWAFRNQLVSQPLTIDVGTRTLWRGRITAVTVGFRTITDPDGTRRQVQVVNIIAKDPLAELGQARPAGPGSGGGWPRQTLNARRTAILNRLRSTQVTDILFNPDTNEIGYNAGDLEARAYRSDTRPSLLTLIKGMYNWERFAVPVYSFNDGTIQRRFAPQNPGLTLAYTSSLLDVTTSTVYDAGNVIVLGREFDSEAENAIDIVQASYYDGAGDQQTFSNETSRYNPEAFGTRVAECSTDIVEAGATAAYGLQLLAESNNSAWAHPSVRFRSPELTMPFDLVFEARTAYFIRSQWEHLTLGHYAIVGGRLTCDGKTWTHDVDLLPCVAPVLFFGLPPTEAAGAPFPHVKYARTITNLVTNPTPTISQWAERVSLATLGYVTVGAS